MVNADTHTVSLSLSLSLSLSVSLCLCMYVCVVYSHVYSHLHVRMYYVAECRNLIHVLIEPNPEMRISMTDIQVNPWITNNGKCPFMPYAVPLRNRVMRNQVCHFVVFPDNRPQHSVEFIGWLTFVYESCGRVCPTFSLSIG